jgi:hypothetical protein
MVKVDTLQGASCSRIFNDATLDSAAKELETPLASTPPSIWILRTELLTEQPTNYAEPSIADYDQRRGLLVEYWKSQNGGQSGDPATLARALITIASQNPPPRRVIAGADARCHDGAEARRSEITD